MARDGDTAPRGIELGAHALVVGVALISIANVPLVPVRGAQLSDVVAAIGAVLVVAGAVRAGGLGGWRASLCPTGVVLAGAYALAACLAFALAGGSAMRLVGYLWLPGLAIAIGLASRDETVARRIRQALLIAALIGAVTGLAGAVLFWLGKPTGLLNIAGDLVPGNYPRIRGTLPRANALAGLLAMGLLLLGDVPRRWRVVVGALFAIALVFTFSRSWIALAAAAAVSWLALRPQHAHERDGHAVDGQVAQASRAVDGQVAPTSRAVDARGAQASRARDVAAIVVVLAGAAIMLAVSWLEVRFDPSHPFDIQLGDGVGTRWTHLTDAVSTITAHPLGVGPGRAATYDGWDAHFSPINIAAVIGIPAAVAFVALLALALVRAIRSARGGDAAMRGVAATLVLFALDALARDVEDQRALWVLVGLALVKRVRRS